MDEFAIKDLIFCLLFLSNCSNFFCIVYDINDNDSD